MATSALRQIITDVLWEDLDYLVLDLPPGTGDIHLTLASISTCYWCLLLPHRKKLLWLMHEKQLHFIN
jgi:cellulose biosynthesis protein BcsQ